MSNNNGDLMEKRITKRGEKCPLLTEKTGGNQGGRCNKRLHFQVCKGLHLVARRFTVIADFQVEKKQPFQAKNFAKNKNTWLYRSSYNSGALRDKEEKLYWNILENSGGGMMSYQLLFLFLILIKILRKIKINCLY